MSAKTVYEPTPDAVRVQPSRSTSSAPRVELAAPMRDTHACPALGWTMVMSLRVREVGVVVTDACTVMVGDAAAAVTTTRPSPNTVIPAFSMTKFSEYTPGRTSTK